MLFQLLANNSGFRVTSSHLLILRHISRNDPIYLVAFRQFAILFFLRLVRRETPVKRTDLNSSDLENVLRFCTKRTRLDSTYTWSCTNEQLDPCAIQKRIRQMFTLPGRFRIVHQQKRFWVVVRQLVATNQRVHRTSYIAPFEALQPNDVKLWIQFSKRLRHKYAIIHLNTECGKRKRLSVKPANSNEEIFCCRVWHNKYECFSGMMDGVGKIAIKLRGFKAQLIHCL